MFDWKRIQLIAGREITTRVKTRTYLWSLIVQMVIVALIAISPILIAKFFNSDDGPVERSVAVVNSADVDAVAGLDSSLQLLADGSNTTWIISEATEENARAQLEEGEIDAAVLIAPDADQLSFTILTEDGDPQGSVAQTLITAVSSISVSSSIQQSGLSDSEITQVFAAPSLQITPADPDSAADSDDDTADIVNYVIAYASTIIIFIFVMIYGQWISQGVVEEKASRIMEIMVNAATPRDLLAGKVIGIMITALMQFIPIVLTAGIIASLQEPIGKLFGVDADQLFNIDLSGIAWSSIGWFTLYFILGFLLFGALYAGIGSLVSRQEEVATAVAPMTTVMMIGYFAALLSMSNPDGIIARIAYLFPGTSVFVAMLRLVMGNPEPWEIAVSIIGLVIAIVLALLVAARLYRVGVLMYGQPPKITEIFKIGKMEGVTR